MIAFRLLGDLRLQVGESPVWDERRGALFLCDVTGQAIHQMSLDGTVRMTRRFDRTVGSLGLAESGRLVVALGRDVVLFDPESDTIVPLAATPEPGTNRLNDGKVGPDGAFWVGSMDDRPAKEPLGRLYRVAGDGSLACLSDGFTVSNGLAWSPDGRTLYHSDSRGPWIDAYDFAAGTGTPRRRRRFADLDEATGRPDGGACDGAGRYWSAGVSAGTLNCFAPDGTLGERHPVPARAPTMPCFCGPGLATLVVTTLTPADGGGEDGRVFVAAAPVPGAPVGRLTGA